MKKKTQNLPLIISVLCFMLTLIFCILLISGIIPINIGGGHAVQTPAPISDATPEPGISTETPAAQGGEADPTIDPDNPSTDPSAIPSGDATATPQSSEKPTGEAPTETPAAEPTAVPTAAPTPEPFEAKAVYLPGGYAGTPAYLQKIIDIANTTELNAVVIDIKNDDGYINYRSDIEVIKQNGFSSNVYDVNSVIETLHANGVYVIGRIVTFKDNLYPRVRTDLSVIKKEPAGEYWVEGARATGCTWFNPYKEDAWDYVIDIALEAVDKGFDEIQFDYVRFPTITDAVPDYGDKVLEDRTGAIAGFLKKAYQKITAEKGVAISADVFGTVYESSIDATWLGQNPIDLGTYTNWVCPMIYPSHYANASNGSMGNGTGSVVNGNLFTAPDLKPYDVVYNAMLSVKKAMQSSSSYTAKARPYLQAFTASYLPSGYYQAYTAEVIKQEIKAVYDAGFTEWILWDAAAGYKAEYFEAE